MAWQILTGDVREVLATLPDASVQCCVTSPPYWGLRDYGTAKWEGGREDCEHSGVARRCDKPGRNDKQSTQKGSSLDRVSRTCLKCGARRIDSQLGLEPTPEAYVATMVQVFRDVRRVLKDEGTLWVNIGDSYSGSGPSGASYQSETTKRRAIGNGQDGVFRVSKTLAERGLMYAQKKPIPAAGLKPKDLVGIPWRLAFALQADGWYLRADIIWSKPNPMPESVTDRPTKAHEYVFLLSKKARYYYDAEAIKEPCSAKTFTVSTTPRKGNGIESTGEKLNLWMEQNGGRYNPTHANCRSVWELATQPYPEAHFATFPEALPERCIKAGSKPGDLVLDPFCGAGTTGLLADRLGRDFVGVELNPQYVELARQRIGRVTPLFPNEVGASNALGSLEA